MAKTKQRPEQKQKKPGKEKKLNPQPDSSPRDFSAGRLKNKVALITGADSGIGKATAILFAKEGADVVIHYLNETADAKDTEKEVLNYGSRALLIKGDLSKEANCKKAIERTISKFGKIDVLVNNAGTHWDDKKLEDISTEQMDKTFKVNFYSTFWMSKYALPHMQAGCSIINTTSVTAFRGSDHLLDYAASKGAILSFTRSLANNMAKSGIRINAVAPGPIWTPLIAASFSEEEVARFGSNSPMGRAGQPYEVASCFLFLACEDGSYVTGQTLHPNGGELVGG